MLLLLLFSEAKCESFTVKFFLEFTDFLKVARVKENNINNNNNIKARKAELDLNFLRNCQSFGVFPKFICFHLPATTNRQDVLAFRKRLLRSAIRKRSKEFHKLVLQRDNLLEHSSTILNTLDRYILQKSIAHNVSKTSVQFIKAPDKKLKKLTKNVVLPFTSKETITNLSGHNLTPDQLEALKFGLTHSIYPPTISKTDVFACFELISHTMKRHLIDTSNTSKIVADLSHLAHGYVSSYRPTTADLKKHSILRSLRRNRDIVILKPDKGNGIVILDRTAYDNGLFSIINDSSKFKPISKDPTLPYS